MKNYFKTALVRYILNNDLQDNYPFPCKSTYLKILPEMHKLDRKWEKVSEKNLSAYKYLAHQYYCDTIRNLLNTKTTLN